MTNICHKISSFNLKIKSNNSLVENIDPKKAELIHGVKHRMADTSFWGRNMPPHQVQMEQNLSCPFAPDEEAC